MRKKTKHSDASFSSLKTESQKRLEEIGKDSGTGSVPGHRKETTGRHVIVKESGSWEVRVKD